MLELMILIITIITGTAIMLHWINQPMISQKDSVKRTAASSTVGKSSNDFTAKEGTAQGRSPPGGSIEMEHSNIVSNIK